MTKIRRTALDRTGSRISPLGSGYEQINLGLLSAFYWHMGGTSSEGAREGSERFWRIIDRWRAPEGRSIGSGWNPLDDQMLRLGEFDKLGENPHFLVRKVALPSPNCRRMACVPEGSFG